MASVELDAYVRPMHGQEWAGDFAICVRAKDHVVAVLIDVLGHGREAFKAGNPLIGPLTALAREPSCSPTALLMVAHELLQESPGAAIAALVVRPQQAEATGASLGNVMVRRVVGRPACLVSRDAVVGHNMRTPVETTLALSDRDLWLLYSDGVQSNFDVHAVREIYTSTAKQVAQTIVAKFGKAHDDASCIAMRFSHPVSR